MRIAITGGAGFIGTNLVKYWLDKHPKDEIIVIDNLTYAANYPEAKEFRDKYPNYELEYIDIAKKDEVKLILCEGFDTIIHLAAESHVDNSIKDSTKFIRTNVIGTQVLLDAALKYGVKRFHHVSTDEVFGALELEPKNFKFTENSPYAPRSPYSASKAASDHLVRAYYHTHGLPVTISNCSNNYGYYQHIEKFIPTIITKILKNEKIPVYGDGLYTRDWIHVLDHCKALDLIVHNGKIGETYLIGGEHEISNIDLVKKILNFFDKSESLIEYVQDRKGHDRRYAVDCSKIKNELGWKPETVFHCELEKVIDWYTKRLM